MKKDLVEKLLHFADGGAGDVGAACRDAADVIVGTMSAVGRLKADNKRLRSALEACGTSFISDPCTVAQGHSLLAAEFRRRMVMANAALATAIGD